jgi:DNA-binding transcriptional LysR family regulator
MNGPGLDLAANPASALIELRSWRQFLALADALHFGRAAQQLHMTQPPLTLAIQQLERRLGTLLFARTRRSVALTPAGAALIEPARQLLRQAAALPAIAGRAAAGEVGRIRLGFVSTVGFGPLPAWLRGFREAHPGISIELREATGDVQLRGFEPNSTPVSCCMRQGMRRPRPGFMLATRRRFMLTARRRLMWPARRRATINCLDCLDCRWASSHSCWRCRRRRRGRGRSA